MLNFKKKITELSNGITIKIQNYFEDATRTIMRNLKVLFDPNEHLLYQSLNEASKHGSNVFESVIKYFKYKQIKIGRTESYRKYEWKQ